MIIMMIVIIITYLSLVPPFPSTYVVLRGLFIYSGNNKQYLPYILVLETRDDIPVMK